MNKTNKAYIRYKAQRTGRGYEANHYLEVWVDTDKPDIHLHPGIEFVGPYQDADIPNRYSYDFDIRTAGGSEFTFEQEIDGLVLHFLKQMDLVANNKEIVISRDSCTFIRRVGPNRELTLTDVDAKDWTYFAEFVEIS